MGSLDPRICVRTASSANENDDAKFILAAWDSTLPFLASIGAGEMWGDQPFSQRQGEEHELVDIIRKLEENKVESDGGQEQEVQTSVEDEANKNSRRLLIAELHRSHQVVRVGAAMIHDTLPTYLTEHVDLSSHLALSHSLLYLEVLIADHRPEQRYTGVGKALIGYLKKRAYSEGKDTLYVDVWAGNGRKLNK